MTPPAARYARWDGLDRPFRVASTPLPVPGPGEVLVRIDLATVCGSDVHTVTGRRSSPTPTVLGHEQVGTVLASERPDAPPPGTRVVWSVTASCGSCDRCRRELPQKCRELRKFGHEPLVEDRPLTGGFATHALLGPGTAVVAVPDGLPDEVAAPASCATATVAAMLAAAGDVASARVLVTGAGMLGLTAAAMATAAGAHVVVSDPDPRRTALAGEFGAVAFGAAEDDPGEVDVALELSGAPAAVRTCLDALAVGGTAVLAGSVTPGPTVPLDPERLVRGLQTVVGVHNYHPVDLAAAVSFLTAHHDRYPFAGLVTGRHALDDVDAAFAAARTGAALRVAVAP